MPPHRTSFAQLRRTGTGLLFLLAAMRAIAANGEGGDMAHWLARLLSREYRQLEARRTSLLAEASRLPVPAQENTTPQLGWHSARLQSAGTNLWIQVDLGTRYPIDLVALVPASAQTDQQRGAGYGFPLRFRIEASDDEEFRTSQLIVDETGADVPNPGAYPYLARRPDVQARYVRVVVTQAWPRREDWIVALGEIFVVSNGSNVAARRPVRSPRSIIALPSWHTQHLTDEHSILGAPTGPGASPTNGYLAARETNPHLTKWVQVDLGLAFPLDEVRLLPTRPTDFADTPGSGFPVLFRVEAADTPDFKSPVTLFTTGEVDFAPPGENPMTILTHGRRARYLRVTATRLHDRGSGSTFALAELEAWSGGRNVARSALVSYFDRFEMFEFPRWQPQYLTDGYNSRNPLLNWPEWLRGLERRRHIERELAENAARRAAAVSAAVTTTAQAGGGVLGVGALVAGALLWRARVVRRREVAAVQRRIASDLHDEIGSYVGSIGLLSEAARRQATIPAVGDDLAEITRIAGRTNEALREIVWLLDLKPMSRAELIGRMRETAPALLSGIPFTFEAPPAPLPLSCSVEFARNVWLVFKETLHNIAKHAGAHHVRIVVTEPRQGLVLEISDDGRGFDPGQPAGGRGLGNLRQRAADLRGTVQIHSTLGQGTRVRLDVPPS